ncbi:MAG: chorismate mutase [Xanthomonadaceae bacterium]|nr:chorismate mutase [Xanthomonadaceae bacterium]MDE2245945.1 chorismate mutase [Xanthomonadaceae bacterium]
MSLVLPLPPAGHRFLIDRIDDALIDGLALRQRIVASLTARKQRDGLPLRDPAREEQVQERARRRAARRHLDPADGERLMRTAIDCALAQQQRTGAAAASAADRTSAFADAWRQRLLGLLPPPQRLALPLRAVPDVWQRRLLEAVTQSVLQAPLRAGKLAFLVDRRIAIEVTDLDLRWVLTAQADRLRTCERSAPAAAAVRGRALEFLLLASRLEDADTLFFQRRLALTGDTELGLTARNLLDQLPWESIPLALRIALHRAARFAAVARDAHAARRAPAAVALTRVPEPVSRLPLP